MRRVFLVSMCAVACGGSEPTIEYVGVNEIASGGDTEDFVELLNVTDGNLDLQGWQLTSSDASEPWTFPPTAEITAGGFEVVWLALPDAGGTVVLWNAQGEQVDSVDFPMATPDEGFGRVPDAAPNWQVIDTPTPGATNG